MATTKTLLRSFAGGEITPELAGRLDLVKYQTGLSLCRNFVVLPHGPVVRRPGTEYVLKAKSRDNPTNVRIVPFSYSADQTMVLEFGHNYIRFHTNGSTVIETAQPIVSIADDTLEITAHGYAYGDWLYINGIYYIIESVDDVDHVRLYNLWGSPGYPTGTEASRVYTLATTYASADLFDLTFAQNADVLTITHPDYETMELRRLGATNWTLTATSFAPSVTTPGAPTVTPTTATPGNPSPQEYCITAVAADGVTESLASASTSTSNDLSIAGNYNTITWSAVGGASRYYVYKRRGGGFGYMGQTTGLSATDDNILPDTTQSPPEDIIALNSGAGDYPGASAYFEQRRWFAGTTDKPQVLFATRTGTETNLTSSLPNRDADGMEVRLYANQNNTIRHLVPLSDLIAFTAGGEFRIFADGGGAITPASISIKPQGYSGASRVQPVVTSGSILYVQAQGARVRELGYGGDSTNNGYKSTDVTLLAPHRFNGYQVTQLAYSRAPDQILWAVRDDGTLCGMTYVPDQQVYGWHFHDTALGGFLSCCVVAEGDEDVLYVVTEREINGVTSKYIERLKTRVFTAQEDSYYVDCGLTYNGTATTTITGLEHLEGAEVAILADGAVLNNDTVVNGEITLAVAASKVHVGLPMTSDIVTLPLSLEGAPAAGQGMVKNINKVHIRVAQASLVKAGPSFSKLREYPARAVSDPYGSPPALRNGSLEISIDPSWNIDGAIYVRQDAPLPITVLSMALEVVTGG